MRYSAEIWDEEQEETRVIDLEATSDDEAIALAKRRFGTSIVYVLKDDGQHANLIIWELEPTMYLKYALDEATSIDEAVDSLEGLVKELKEMQAQGLELAEADGGHLRFRRSDAELDELEAAADER